MTTVITYGSFDLYHSGHQRLLERARQLGDRLIVGVTSDFYDQSRGKLNVIQSCEERMENVRKTGLADKIIIEEEEGQKIQDIQKYEADIFAIGSDWIGKFDYLQEFCKVVYLERTKGVSSTALRIAHSPIIRVGIVGCGRIARRFLFESKYVSGIEVTSVYGRNTDKVSDFASQYEISEYFTDFSKLLSKVDAIYLALPHHLHAKYAKEALLEGKHVLCEKPLSLSAREAADLFSLAEEKGCVLMEAVKTAYAPAFQQLIGIAKSGRIGRIKTVDASFTKLITNKALREYDKKQAGGAFTELSSYAILAVTKLLGTEPLSISFTTEIEPISEVDIFTRASFIYPGAIATATTGIGIKREGDLCIGGTTGYIYVPAPWWKTEYFEVRYEDERNNRKYFTKFDDDGLRYEIAAFLRRINNREVGHLHLNCDESIFMASVIEKYRKGEQVSYL